MNEKNKQFLKNMTQIGTPECAIFMGVVGLVLGILFLLFGFFKTLLLCAIIALFVFLGAVKDKKEFISNLMNRFSNGKHDAYKDYEKLLKEKLQKEKQAQQAETEVQSASDSDEQEKD